MVVEFLGGQLPAHERRRVQQHLDSCAHCSEVVEQSREDGDWVPALAQALRAPPALAADERIGERYRVVRFIGRGGMGEVYEVEDLALGERIALKTVGASIARDPRMTARLKREVQLARKVTHANVCRIFDFGVHRAGRGEALVFLTMELLIGETLRERLRRVGRMSPAEALPVVIQLCDALATAHAAGVIHRDFKSDNVMLLAGSGRVVVTDFGLARDSVADRAGLSSSGDLVGTLAYMAPEQLLGQPLTAAVDQYALGVVLYELLTGQLPFAGESSLAAALKRLQQEPPWPRALVPELDQRWETVVLRCLRSQAADRFVDAREIAAALAATPPRPATARRPRARLALLAVVAVAGVAAAVVGPRLARPRPTVAPTVVAARAATAAAPPALAAPPASTPAKPAAAAPATLVVRTSVRGARLAVDGRVLTIVDGEARTSLPPGTHQLVAALPDGRDWRRTLTLGAGEERRVTVPARLPRAPARRADPYDDVVDPYGARRRP
jgi:hypothetical protein